MALLNISKGYKVIIDDEDFSIVSGYTWCAAIRANIVYADAYIKGSGRKNAKRIMMHRLIMKPPYGMSVDHINGNGLDNRRCNLRVCTHAQNLANSRSFTGISKYKGVTFDKSRNKWIAQIRVNYEHKMIGRFSDEKSAAKAYDEAAKIAFGSFARLNITKKEALEYC